MTTIKSFTDISQSKKLAEILPLESADMYYSHEFVNSAGDYYKLNIASEGYFDNKELLGSDIPCWSLASLRNLLPTAIKPNKDSYLFLFESHNTFDNSWVYRYYHEDDTSYLYCKDTNEVDACYELILKLHELKML